MISRYEKEILDKLLIKYERSKSFIGDNKVTQRFAVKVSLLFPKYMDHSNYETFKGVNEAIDILVRKQFINAKASASQVHQEVTLNLSNISQAYLYCNRLPKKDINEALQSLLNKYCDKNELLHDYCRAQSLRIKANKPVHFYNGDLAALENILIAVEELMKVDTETFERDFSVRVFKNSKTFGELSSKAVNLIYEYGNFPEREQVLGNLNIVKNPTYVNFKGNGKINLRGQLIDLSQLTGDIGISSVMLKDIESIEIAGKAVITIENLTSFHTFRDMDMFAIYLGGYHNGIRREFIKKIYSQNPGVKFYHFGDIDAGGFYILEHLKRQTSVNFIPYKMDLSTLIEYSNYCKRLTEHDRERLATLKDGTYSNVIQYMLEHDCKLEQEATNV